MEGEGFTVANLKVQIRAEGGAKPDLIDTAIHNGWPVPQLTDAFNELLRRRPFLNLDDASGMGWWLSGVGSWKPENPIPWPPSVKASPKREKTPREKAAELRHSLARSAEAMAIPFAERDYWLVEQLVSRSVARDIAEEVCDVRPEVLQRAG